VRHSSRLNVHLDFIVKKIQQNVSHVQQEHFNLFLDKIFASLVQTALSLLKKPPLNVKNVDTGHSHLSTRSLVSPLANSDPMMFQAKFTIYHHLGLVPSALLLSLFIFSQQELLLSYESDYVINLCKKRSYCQKNNQGRDSCSTPSHIIIIDDNGDPQSIADMMEVQFPSNITSIDPKASFLIEYTGAAVFEECQSTTRFNNKFPPLLTFLFQVL